MQPTPRYDRIAIYLHWIIAGLIFMQLLGGYVMAHIMADGADKFRLFQLHKSFGFLILFLTALRLLWRLTHTPPPLPAAMPIWQKRAARLTHAALYVLMFALPISGWMTVSASPLNIPTKLFGSVPVPNIAGIEPSKAAAEDFARAHYVMAICLAVLLAGHIGAALKHYYIDRDYVLSMILPWVRMRVRPPKN